MTRGGKDAERHRLLGVVHIAVKALGLEDDDYRAILRREAQVESARDCSVAQLRSLVAEFERLGYRGRGERFHRTNLASHPVAKKARALWISLHALGVVDDPSERALEALGKRQLGVDRLHWADQSQGARLIEALKAMAERAGWDQRLPVHALGPEAGRILKVRLLALLMDRLRSAGVEIADRDPNGLSDVDLDIATGELGALYRQHLAEMAGA